MLSGSYLLDLQEGLTAWLKKIYGQLPTIISDNKTKEGQMIEIFLDAPIELEVILLTGLFYSKRAIFTEGLNGV